MIVAFGAATTMASNVPQPQQPQDPRTFQDLALSLDCISKQDLCSISTLNGDFLTAATRENHLWQPIFYPSYAGGTTLARFNTWIHLLSTVQQN